MAGSGRCESTAFEVGGEVGECAEARVASRVAPLLVLPTPPLYTSLAPTHTRRRDKTRKSKRRRVCRVAGGVACASPSFQRPFRFRFVKQFTPSSLRLAPLCGLGNTTRGPAQPTSFRLHPPPPPHPRARGCCRVCRGAPFAVVSFTFYGLRAIPPPPASRCVGGGAMKRERL